MDTEQVADIMAGREPRIPEGWNDIVKDDNNNFDSTQDLNKKKEKKPRHKKIDKATDEEEDVAI